MTCWKPIFCMCPKSAKINGLTPNKRLTHLRGRFLEPQGMQYSYLGSFVSAVNNLRFCTRRVLEGTVHRTKIPIWGPSLRNSEKCLENLNLKIRNLKMPSKTQCLPRPYRTCNRSLTQCGVDELTLFPERFAWIRSMIHTQLG